MKTIIVIIFLISLSFILPSYSTHISEPILTLEKTSYKINEKIPITGQIRYNENPASNVLVNLKIYDPKEQLVIDEFTHSGKNGEFLFDFVPENSIKSGNHKIIVTSFCLEEHRQICTFQRKEIIISIEPEFIIPKWLQNTAGWWSENKVTDLEFTNSIKYLIDNKIIIIPNTSQDNSISEQKIPDWIKNNAQWWSKGLISDKEFVNGIEFMIKSGILKISFLN